VAVFDKSTALGGIVKSVIPPDRQGSALKSELAALFAEVPGNRMILHLGQALGSDCNLDTILAQGFDAAFIGLGLPKSVSVADKPLDGLWNAMDFLSAAKQGNGPDLAGKSVAVIGGGNTAMDVAVTAGRLGARDVYVVYRRSFKEMPAWSAERDRAMREGVHFLILTQPLEYNSHHGRLTGLKLCPTRLGAPDASGRRRPEPVESSRYELEMDIVVEAIGQAASDKIEEILPGVDFEHGRIRTKSGTLATARPGVFAGGDLVRGPATVVAAVADGLRAAREIEQFLRVAWASRP
jgi:NADPH-dependent glutamate synthase beta subunit-like oxidoreductase